MAARCVTAAFGVATVGVVHRLARVSLPGSALLAALLLAVNPPHVARSQLVEVDVPLTFFVWLALTQAVLVAERPTRSRYVLAGLAAGLAASAKYTGALTLPAVLVAHWLSGRARSDWRHPLLCVGVAAAAFVATSPYVLLDLPTAARHLATESQHMELGHFGRESGPTVLPYLRSLVEDVVGWPVLVLGAIGLVRFAVWRRRPWAIVLASFVIP